MKKLFEWLIKGLKEDLKDLDDLKKEIKVRANVIQITTDNMRKKIEEMEKVLREEK